MKQVTYIAGTRPLSVRSSEFMVLDAELAVLHLSDYSLVNDVSHIFKIFLVFKRNYSPLVM